MLYTFSAISIFYFVIRLKRRQFKPSLELSRQAAQRTFIDELYRIMLVKLIV